jgi:hypothetical protein
LQADQAKLIPQKLASNPGSGTHKSPANAGLFGFSVSCWSIRGPIPRKRARKKGVARPDTGPWQDRLASVGRSSNGRANRERERVRRRLRAQAGRRVNYARRQQYRRLSHAGRAALGSVVLGLLGLVVASAGAAALRDLLLLTAVGLGLYARYWLSLAGRSRVGARSPRRVPLPARSETVGVGAKMPVRQRTQGAPRGRHDGQTAAAPRLYDSADGPALDRPVPMYVRRAIVDDA